MPLSIVSPRPTSITGVVLAGGRARRMGGKEKGLLPLGRRPMIEYVLENLRPQVTEVVISANRNLERFGSYGHRVITDRIAGSAGPLAGMAAAVQATDSELILAVPCDAPRLPSDLTQRLRNRLEEEEADLCTVHDGTRLQPAFTLIRRRLLPTMLTYLEGGDRKLGLWIRQQNPALADFSDRPDAFFNVNTPEELEIANERLGLALSGQRS